MGQPVEQGAGQPFGAEDLRLTVFIMPQELGGGMNLSAILSVLYPAITAFCINVIFKEDLSL